MISADRILASCRTRQPTNVCGWNGTKRNNGFEPAGPRLKYLRGPSLKRRWWIAQSSISEQQPNKKIAVVGGDFAGLTITAGLLEKGADAHITIFEERDTLLPFATG